jgi:two-component system, chemotaxis family, CheB/CheR fusion protein
MNPKSHVNEIQVPMKSFDNIQNLTDNLILQQYSPAGVLVNSEGDIIYLTRRSGKYLEPAAGKANMNIFSMLREGFTPEFPVAFRRAV